MRDHDQEEQRGDWGDSRERMRPEPRGREEAKGRDRALRLEQEGQLQNGLSPGCPPKRKAILRGTESTLSVVVHRCFPWSSFPLY